VIEVTITINAIVTSQTVLSEIHGMGDGKIHVEGTVTIDTGTLIKLRNALDMAVTAGEGFAIRPSLMPRKGVASFLMGKVDRIHEG